MLADRLVYEMHKGITACRYSLSKIATAIEEELYEVGRSPKRSISSPRSVSRMRMWGLPMNVSPQK